MASDCERLLMLPGAIESDSPVSAEKASRGSPHNGPCTRGNSTNSSSMKGAACSSIRPVRRSRSAGGRGRRRGCRAPR